MDERLATSPLLSCHCSTYARIDIKQARISRCEERYAGIDQKGNGMPQLQRPRKERVLSRFATQLYSLTWSAGVNCLLKPNCVEFLFVSFCKDASLRRQSSCQGCADGRNMRLSYGARILRQHWRNQKQRIGYCEQPDANSRNGRR